MMRTWKVLSVTLLVISLTFIASHQVKAQGYPYINAEILPSEGGANTPILLQFLTTNLSVGYVATADIYWDNNPIAINEPGIIGANGAYDYNLTIPNEPPLSDIGNHIIRVDSSVTPYGAVSFSFTFNVTEFVPSPEYIALNNTYNSLLASYTNILVSYTELQSNYTQLSANYTLLMNEFNNNTLNYNTLVSQYNVLNSNYNSLSANYNFLTTNYGNLTATYISLSTNYASLQENLHTLASNYTTLSQNYAMLNSSYAGLLSNYNGLAGQLDFSRNLNYALLAVTIALIVITVYLATIKPKRSARLR